MPPVPDPALPSLADATHAERLQRCAEDLNLAVRRARLDGLRVELILAPQTSVQTLGIGEVQIGGGLAVKVFRQIL